MIPEANNQVTSPSFFGRFGGFLKRLLLAFLKLGLVFIVIALLVGAAWLIYQEINRSFNSVVTRTDINTRRIEETEKGIDSLKATAESQREEAIALQAAAATSDAQITTLEDEVAAEQVRQDELLVVLEGQLSSFIESTETISGNVELLNEGLFALQQDTTANVSEIDALGGQVDALQTDLGTLNGELVAVQTELGAFSAEEFDRMRQTLVLFRAWESIGRARLRLFEGNAGLATADLEAASAAVGSLLVTVAADAEMTEALERVQQRLDLAASNLPDDLDAAGRDLETAWERVDLILSDLLLVAETQIEPTITPAAIEPTTSPTPTVEASS